MLSKEKIEKMVNDHLQDTDKFLVEVEVTPQNIINVFVDGDEGVTISNCVDISRYIETNLDREEEDFELRVSSPGLDKPFKLLRQYKKYMNRMIRVELKDGEKKTGKLIAVDEQQLEIEFRAKGKSRETVSETIPMDRVKAAKPEISFK